MKKGKNQVVSILLLVFLILNSILMCVEGKDLKKKSPKGYVTITVEKFSLGLGYILEPKKVPFYEGDTYKEVTIRGVGDENLVYNDSYGFWVDGIKDEDNRTPKWPTHILENVRSEDELNEVGRLYDGYLYQNDYNPGESGWMYSVNGKFPDVVASGKSPKNGDVIRWQFTVGGIGRDIGSNPEGSDNAASWGEDFAKIANKEELTNVIGEINHNKSLYLKSNNIKTMYYTALALLEDIISPQEEINEICKDLKIEMKKIKEDNISEEKDKEIEVILPPSENNDLEDKNDLDSNSENYDILNLNQKNIYENKYGSINFLDSNINKQKLKIKLIKDNGYYDIKIMDKNNKPIKITKPLKVKLNLDNKYKDGESTVVLRDKNIKLGGNFEKDKVYFLLPETGKLSIINNKTTFDDLKKYYWAEKQINTMASKGIIKGISKNRFAPSSNVTRAEFTTLAYRMLKLKEKNNKNFAFKDVKERDWYYKPIKISYENNLINGRSHNEFDPNGNITRQEMAKIACNMLNVYSNKNKVEEENLRKIKDIDKTSDWARKDVEFIISLGIMQGDDLNNFNPKNYATRAETAVMLNNLYEYIVK